MTKILKIKYHKKRILPLSKRLPNPRFSFRVDVRLDDILDQFSSRGVNTKKSLAGVPKGFMTVYQNNLLIEDKNHIVINLNGDDENFINDQLNKSDKVKESHKDKEFEVISKEEIEKEL